MSFITVFLQGQVTYNLNFFDEKRTLFFGFTFINSALFCSKRAYFY
jgi:hypothetical protein